MWGGFVIKKIILQFVVANTAVANRENYGSQKMNLIIHVKKKIKRPWFDQLATFFVLNVIVWIIFFK